MSDGGSGGVSWGLDEPDPVSRPPDNLAALRDRLTPAAREAFDLAMRKGDFTTASVIVEALDEGTP